MSFTVDRFSVNNIRDVVNIGQLLHSKSVYSVTKFNRKKAYDLANAIAAGASNWNGFIAYDGQPVGFIYGWMDTYTFSDDLMASIEAVYVSPSVEDRGQIANSLLNHFTEWAFDRGAKLVFTWAAAGIEDQAAASFYVRNKFVRSGGIYRLVKGDSDG